ncbi:uncharacterized protein TNCV_4363491 [Trichonephila clavipes]|nr:uncharacterized protein TNCV_4363491 [Trichonephila clavipes]
MSLVVKLKRDELRLVAEEIDLTVPRDAKVFYIKRLIEESDVFKEDYEFVKTVIEQVVEKSKTQKFKLNSQIELGCLKLERVKVELKLEKLRNSANNCEISLNVCDTEMSINEDMELPQATERVIPLESERAKRLNVGPDAMAQPVTVPEEKCLPRALLISTDEMCEEKEERLVDVIKETAKEDINPVVLNSEPSNLNNDEIEEIITESVVYKPNLKASSNVIFVQRHLCFKRNHSQVKRGAEQHALKLLFIQRIGFMRRRPITRKKVRLKSRVSDIDSQKYCHGVRKKYTVQLNKQLDLF